MLNELVDKSKSTESGIANKLDKFQTDVNTVLEQLNQALKGDHVMERQDVSRGATGRGTRQSMLLVANNLNNLRGNSRKMIKSLYAKIREISGDIFRHDRYSTNIYCNVFFETSMFTIIGQPAKHGVVRFSEDEGVGLVEGVLPDDERTVSFQVMSGTGDSERDEELGLFYVTVDDLFMAEGCYVDYFINRGGSNSQMKLSVTSMVSLTPA